MILVADEQFPGGREKLDSFERLSLAAGCHRRKYECFASFVAKTQPLKMLIGFACELRSLRNKIDLDIDLRQVEATECNLVSVDLSEIYIEVNLIQEASQ